MTNYAEFLDTKLTLVPADGFSVDKRALSKTLFPFQKAITQWAIRKGRCAVFADTGLGKTFMQVEWARIIHRETHDPVLIAAPLSVARQTARMAQLLKVDVHYTRSGSDIKDGLNITNYEMVEHFNASDFVGVVLDESSILKSLSGKTRKYLTDAFVNTPYRLCCTATPAPNDIAEIANHAEFLGIMSRADMLAQFFVHDDDGYRLKGHAREKFYQWLASWAMSVRHPSDIGFSDDGYILPELTINPVFVGTGYVPDGQLLFTGLKGIQDRTKVRKSTLVERVKTAADLVNASNEQWIVWCGLNDEQSALEQAIDGCVSVEGSQSPEDKAKHIEAFQDGEHRVLVIKPKIGGFGLNLQNAHNMVFVGLSDSWESYYQCIRRCYRFGQTQPVNVYIVLSDAEDAIYHNVQAKEKEALTMSDELVKHVQGYEQAELTQHDPTNGYTYQQNTANGERFTLMLGDSCERLSEVESDSVGFSVYSPPFMSLYTYSPTERDLGNSRNEHEFFTHFDYIIKETLRATMPGRLTACHVAQVPAMAVRDGFIGLKDFRGKTIQAFIDAGWIHHGEAVIDKDPQAQAIRTKSKALLFVQVHKDSSWSRPALADFILVFRKPGDNPTPVIPDITNEEWIEWARPIWYNIKETDTLQFREARENDDERHICPLQLGTIERCIRLWSNKGDLVLSPFAGIGSEGYVALRNERQFVGCELKESYWRVAVRNLTNAEQHQSRNIFNWNENDNDH